MKIKQISDPIFDFSKPNSIATTGTIEKADYKAVAELDARLCEKCELQDKNNLKAIYTASKTTAK